MTINDRSGGPTADDGYILGMVAALEQRFTGVVVLAAAAGAGWSRYLRTHQPGACAAVGRGQPRPLAVPERGLADLEL